MAGAFLVSGVAHLVRPEVFEPLIPPELGHARGWVLVSGVAELGCAAGIITRQRWAPAAATVTLLVIWVGNAEMARRFQASSRPTWQKALAWGRLPLQLPLIHWAANSGR